MEAKLTLGTLAPLKSTSDEVHSPGLAPAINALEADGLVSKSTDPADRRRQLLTITPAGAALIEDDRARRDAWLERAVVQALSPLEADLLHLVGPLLRRLAESPEQ